MTLIRDFTPRLYQESILNSCIQGNTLVVLPTGLGKTGVAILVAAHRILQYPTSKIVMVAPTKPLAEQHKVSFQKHLNLPAESFAVFTGDIAPEERQRLWPEKQFIFATPQGIENDLVGNKLDVSSVSLLIIDEAHRAVGEYSYVFLAKQYQSRAVHPRLLALTASPGSEVDKIKELCNNLSIERVEVRTDSDADVAPYVHDIDADWVEVELPDDFKRARNYLDICFRKKIAEVKNLGFTIQNAFSKKELLGIQRDVVGKLNAGEAEPETYKALSLLAEAMKVSHALELFESQGVAATYGYCEKMYEEAQHGKVKAVKNLVADPDFKSAVVVIRSLREQKKEHPKFAALRNIVENALTQPPDIGTEQQRTASSVSSASSGPSSSSSQGSSKIIIFTQFRDTAKVIAEQLGTIQGASPKIFVGQQKRAGLGISQKKQMEMLDQFRAGSFNILVATSVAEEGLDIPQVDMVVFYEPIPSAIRHIQRRGRTGRQRAGSLKILLAKGTRDEVYRWTAHHKEKIMQKHFAAMKAGLSSFTTTRVPGQMPSSPLPAPSTTVPPSPLPLHPAQKTLAGFGPLNGGIPLGKEQPSLRFVADHREKSSGIIRALVEMGYAVELAQLGIGDYLLSRRVGVEFKQTQDFIQSILDGRLLQQLKELKGRFERPLLIIQGERDLTAGSRLHPNSIYGMLATIGVSFGIPMLWTKTTQETAALFVTIAKREQSEEKNLPQLHFEKRMTSLPGLQEYVVASLPNIGPQLAKDLLTYLGSVRAIMNADEQTLTGVPGVGEKKAKGIRDVVDGQYGEKNHPQ